AKLQTIPGTSIDPKAFYDIVTKPPDSLVAAYPWLKDPKIRPAGATLEGFLYPATYKVRIDPLKPTDAMGLVRMMLDEFVQQVGTDRMKVPKERGMTFQQVLTLASIVEREAALDEERPLIAGVYENRLDPKKWTTRLLQSDPTVFYVNDTLQLEAMPFGQWKTYVFWAALTGQLPATLPPAVAGYNTYTHRGLPPGPICTPTADSIDAALNPDTKTGYLFFLALPDGSGKSVFARTQAEHERNVAKYGTN
ncbi:MAG: endolytic transglycosylase MltG, partial [Chloroflexota bacterium]